MFTSFIINVAQAGVITDAPTLKQVGVNILNFLLSVAGIIAIISLVVSGIIYIFSAGDERRAEFAKRAAKYSVLGIILILGGMIIVKTIGSFLN